MLFANYDRYQYARSPLVEVICQLRFPTILTIGAKEPAEFQEAIRGDFPRYLARQEQAAPKIAGLGGSSPQMEPQPPVTNYNFISSDGAWKLNLTSSFIALSTLRYSRWEEFAQTLDKPLAEFIQIYRPTFFERIGLRYVNAISRKLLGVEELLWDDLIQPAYLGVLGEPDVDEEAVSKSSLEIEMNLQDDCRLKLHAGPGLINGGKGDPEVKYILDNDLSSVGELSADVVPGRLETLHSYAVRLFRGAITSELHTAMGALPLE